MIAPPRLMLLSLALLPGVACAAFSVGGKAYTKRMETKLLDSPSALGKPAATLGFAKTLSVLEIKGAWLKVSEASGEGWVFQGNLSEELPNERVGMDHLPVAAAQTTATAAARPIAPEAGAYAARRGMQAAKADLEWLEAQAAKTTDEEVDEYLESEGKGQFQ